MKDHQRSLQRTLRRQNQTKSRRILFFFYGKRLLPLLLLNNIECWNEEEIMIEFWANLFLCLTKKLLFCGTTLKYSTAKILPLSPLCLSFENDVGTRDEFTRRRRVPVVVVF